MAATEPIHDIATLGSIELLTPKPEKSLWYFRDILGMEVVAEEGSKVHLRGYGDFAMSTLTLTAAKHAGIGTVAWRTVSPAALDRRVRALTAAGLAVGWSDKDFGRGRSFHFRDPDGHAMAVYYDEVKYSPPAALRSTLKNLPQKYTGRGASVRRTDHLALLCKDVEKNRRFAEDLLGFQLRETVLFEKGTFELGSWLSPNAIHHQLAYVVDIKGASGRLHHISMWVDQREDVLRAADVLAENGIFIEAGPSKHNNSQAFYLYSYEPGGNRVEIYSGSYVVLSPDWEPVTWNEDERGTGVYWGGALPDSFIQYATPDVCEVQKLARPIPVFDPA
ncbi:MAG TPA: VOC family protein [Casimicrobiaceae bacterium]|nr:VOC family protein [Casimicrobiaceae bacterium]